jgi:FSR family fosmidomycin resistance protein-like MFS transporter
MVLRSIAATGYADMIAFVLTDRGEEAHIGATLAAFNIAGAVGALAGGRLSDRFGRMAVIRWALITSLPLIPLLVRTPAASWWYYPLVVVLGVVINAPLPISVAAAQEYAPRHVATASAMMMGFAWGMAGLLFPVIGLLADATSPEMSIQISALVLLPAVLMSTRLPEPKR